MAPAKWETPPFEVIAATYARRFDDLAAKWADTSNTPESRGQLSVLTGLLILEALTKGLLISAPHVESRANEQADRHKNGQPVNFCGMARAIQSDFNERELLFPSDPACLEMGESGHWIMRPNTGQFCRLLAEIIRAERPRSIDDAEWPSVTDAARESGATTDVISKAATSGSLRSNGKSGRDRRIDPVSLVWWNISRSARL